MKNFRNIQVEESNLLAWQGLIVPVSCCSFSGWSEIRRPEVPFTNLVGSLSGQPSLWQRCIQDWNHFPHRVPFQASQDHIQDKDLPPQHWWEGPGVLACDQCRELEACHQNWPRLVLKSYTGLLEVEKCTCCRFFWFWSDVMIAGKKVCVQNKTLSCFGNCDIFQNLQSVFQSQSIFTQSAPCG